MARNDANEMPNVPASFSGLPKSASPAAAVSCATSSDARGDDRKCRPHKLLGSARRAALLCRAVSTESESVDIGTRGRERTARVQAGPPARRVRSSVLSPSASAFSRRTCRRLLLLPPLRRRGAGTPGARVGYLVAAQHTQPGTQPLAATCCCPPPPQRWCWAAGPPWLLPRQALATKPRALRCHQHRARKSPLPASPPRESGQCSTSTTPTSPAAAPWRRSASNKRCRLSKPLEHKWLE